MRPRGLPLLGEVLLVGVLVLVAALPVVTVLAALAAGCVVLREYVTDGRVASPVRYARLFGRALWHPVALAAPAAALVLAGLDVLALAAGVPGAVLLGPVIGLGLAALGVLLLRGAAAWRPDRGWVEALRVGAATATARPGGSLMLAGALLVALLVGSRLPSLLPVLPGLLVLAVVAVDRPATEGG